MIRDCQLVRCAKVAVLVHQDLSGDYVSLDKRYRWDVGHVEFIAALVTSRDLYAIDVELELRRCCLDVTLVYREDILGSETCRHLRCTCQDWRRHYIYLIILRIYTCGQALGVVVKVVVYLDAYPVRVIGCYETYVHRDYRRMIVCHLCQRDCRVARDDVVVLVEILYGVVDCRDLSQEVIMSELVGQRDAVVYRTIRTVVVRACRSCYLDVDVIPLQLYCLPCSAMALAICHLNGVRSLCQVVRRDYPVVAVLEGVASCWERIALCIIQCQRVLCLVLQYCYRERICRARLCSMDLADYWRERKVSLILSIQRADTIVLIDDIQTDSKSLLYVGYEGLVRKRIDECAVSTCISILQGVVIPYLPPVLCIALSRCCLEVAIHAVIVDVTARNYGRLWQIVYVDLSLLVVLATICRNPQRVLCLITRG